MRQTTRNSQKEIPDSLRQNVGFLVNRTARMLREELGESLKPLALSVNEFVIMRMIELQLAETQQSVGERYGVDRTTMVEIVDRLEERQLLTRETNQQDRRTNRLRLTPKGRKTLSRAKRIAERAQKRFLEPLNEHERDILQSCLTKLICKETSE